MKCTFSPIILISCTCRWARAEPAGLGGAAPLHARPRPRGRGPRQLPLLWENKRRHLRGRDSPLRYSLLQHIFPHLDHGGEEITYINNARIDMDERLIQSEWLLMQARKIMEHDRMSLGRTIYLFISQLMLIHFLSNRSPSWMSVLHNSYSLTNGFFLLRLLFQNFEKKQRWITIENTGRLLRWEFLFQFPIKLN